ncbi:MAG: hypothetical protein ACREJG_05105, partial [Candidatus Rokuibacteriota bacterium]
ALAAYLAGARPLELDLSRVDVRSVREAPVAPGELVGALVGLLGATGDTVGVGVATGLDTAARRLTVETPVRDSAVAAVVVGRERPDG